MRYIDDKRREFIFPERIVLLEGDTAGSEFLLKEKELQISVSETDLFVIKGKASVILDYGCEHCGGVRILTERAYSAEGQNLHPKVRIRFGESVSETCADIGFKGATNDHAVRDMEVIIGQYSDMEFGNTGFRFVRLDFCDGDAIIRIKSIVAVSVYRDLPYIGSFKCDDELLNNIYSVARKTCHLSMQDMLWDGIKRDRLVWIGDMHPEMMTIRCVFGYDKCIEEGLLYAVRHFELPKYINEIPSYSMWFVIILYDWYMQNKNTEFVRGQLDYIERLYAQFAECVNQNGELILDDYFFDWFTRGFEGCGFDGATESKTGVQALLYISLNRAIELYNIFGKDSGKLVALKERLSRFKLPMAKTKQAMAFSVLSGRVKPDSEALQCLLRGNSRGLSTFMSYYVLKVLAENGYEGKALEILKEYYGAMLDKGATTFWEDFNVDWVQGSGRIDRFPEKGEKDIHGDFGNFCYKGFRHSLCHGWASGPVTFLTEFVMGVKVVEAGCRKLIIRPNLGNLNYVIGDYPTPYGVVHIEHRKINGKTQTTFTAPDEVEVEAVNDK